MAAVEDENEKSRSRHLTQDLPLINLLLVGRSALLFAPQGKYFQDLECFRNEGLGRLPRHAKTL